ncbi:MAG: threonine/serine exporter family protein [Oscillospiraceae bacterium]|nr:threonine/serine exporter family protein [Oscillospiraceae bacterium]
MTPELTKTEQAELVSCLLDMGQMLLDCGAEISRVEDTLTRMAKAYGCIRAEVFVITSIISLSMEFREEEALTETRRIYSSTGTDFTRLEELNHISRSCCQSPLPVPLLKKSLQQVSSESRPFSSLLAGSILAAGGFAVFFGGSLWDGLAAAAFAIGICLLQKKLGETQISPVGMNLLISLLAGLSVGLVCLAVPALHMDKILIGDIMLLIPGLAITNAVRNMLGGKTISGLVRLTESLIWAAALAGGFMTSILIIDLLL